MSHIYNWGANKPSPEDVKTLQALLDDADAKLAEAAAFAREKKIQFHYDGPAYGMGGSFYPEKDKDEWGEDSNGWQASSHSC